MTPALRCDECPFQSSDLQKLSRHLAAKGHTLFFGKQTSLLSTLATRFGEVPASISDAVTKREEEARARILDASAHPTVPPPTNSNADTHNATKRSRRMRKRRSSDPQVPHDAQQQIPATNFSGFNDPPSVKLAFTHGVFTLPFSPSDPLEALNSILFNDLLADLLEVEWCWPGAEPDDLQALFDNDGIVDIYPKAPGEEAYCNAVDACRHIRPRPGSREEILLRLIMAGIEPNPGPPQSARMHWIFDRTWTRTEVVLWLLRTGLESNPGPSLFWKHRFSAHRTPFPKYAIVALTFLVLLPDWISLGVPLARCSRAGNPPYCPRRARPKRIQYRLTQRHVAALVAIALRSIHPNPGPTLVHGLVTSTNWSGLAVPALGPDKSLELTSRLFPLRESCPLLWKDGCKIGVFRTHCFRNDHAGVYVPCTSANIVVIDIDDRTPQTEAVVQLAAASGCNLVVLSPKGAHLYFQYAEGWRPASKEGLDVKCAVPSGDPSKGDIILCPPSFIIKEGSRTEYTFLVEPGSSPLVPAPIALRDMISAMKPRRKKHNNGPANPIVTLDCYWNKGSRGPVVDEPKESADTPDRRPEELQEARPQGVAPDPTEIGEGFHEEASLLAHDLGLEQVPVPRACPACRLTVDHSCNVGKHVSKHLRDKDMSPETKLALCEFLAHHELFGCTCGFVGPVTASQDHLARCPSRFAPHDPSKTGLEYFRGLPGVPRWWTVAHIPAHLRQRIAAVWGAELRYAVQRNDEYSWKRALSFPPLVLKTGCNTASRLEAWIAGDFKALWDPTAPTGPSKATKKRPPSTQHAMNRATSLAMEGNYRKAVESLFQGAKVTEDLASWSVLQGLHPRRASPPTQPATTVHSDEDAVLKELRAGRPPRLSPDVVRQALESFPNGSSAGPSQLKASHLKELVIGDPSNTFLEILTSVVQLMADGKMSDYARRPLADAILIGIAKKQGGVRPIAIGEVLRRLTAKSLIATLKPALMKTIGPSQFGFGTPGGSAALIHEVRQALRSLDIPEAVLVKIDFSNAFNTVDRQLVIDVVADEAPALLPFVWWLYGSESNLRFGDLIILSAQGVQQGCPLGPILFSLALKRVLSKITSPLPRFQSWFLDDGTVIGHPREVERWVEDLRRCGAEVGLVINDSKSEVVTVAGPETDILKNFARPGNNFSLLGTPFGSTEFVHDFAKHEVLDKASAICTTLADLGESHVAFTLLRQCVSSSRLVHLMRTVDPDQLRRTTTEFDSIVRDCLTKILGRGLPAHSLIQASLRIADGGLGLRECSKHADCAFVAGSRCHIPSGQPPLGDAAHDRALARLVSTYGLTPADADGASQHLLSAVVDKVTKTSLLNASDTHNKARLQCVSQNNAHFLTVIPSKDLRLLLTKVIFNTAVRWWLGAPVAPPGKCPKCHASMDEYGYHALTCPNGGDMTIRHNALRNVVCEAARQGAMSPKVEVSVVPGSNRRQADLLLPGTIGVVCDFAVTHPLQPSYVDKVAKDGPAAATERYATTHKVGPDKDAVEQHGYQYMACVSDVFGNWNASGNQVLSSVARALASRDSRPVTAHLQALRQRCSVVLTLWNMRAIICRWNPEYALREDVPQNATEVEEELVADGDIPKTNIMGLSLEAARDSVHR